MRNYENENRDYRNDRDNRTSRPCENYAVDITGSFDGKCNIEGNVDVKININIDLDGASITEFLKAMAVANKAGQAEENVKAFLEGAVNKEVSAINNGFGKVVESINNRFNHKSEDK